MAQVGLGHVATRVDSRISSALHHRQVISLIPASKRACSNVVCRMDEGVACPFAVTPVVELVRFAIPD